MRLKMRKKASSSRGASGSEYGILAALVSLVAIGSVAALGSGVSDMFGTGSDQLTENRSEVASMSSFAAMSMAGPALPSPAEYLAQAADCPVDSYAGTTDAIDIGPVDADCYVMDLTAKGPRVYTETGPAPYNALELRGAYMWRDTNNPAGMHTSGLVTVYVTGSYGYHENLGDITGIYLPETSSEVIFMPDTDGMIYLGRSYGYDLAVKIPGFTSEGVTHQRIDGTNRVHTTLSNGAVIDQSEAALADLQFSDRTISGQEIRDAIGPAPPVTAG